MGRVKDIQHIAKDANAKYCYGKSITCEAGVAIEKPGEDLMVVFWT